MYHKKGLVKCAVACKLGLTMIRVSDSIKVHSTHLIGRDIRYVASISTKQLVLGIDYNR